MKDISSDMDPSLRFGISEKEVVVQFGFQVDYVAQPPRLWLGFATEDTGDGAGATRYSTKLYQYRKRAEFALGSV